MFWIYKDVITFGLQFMCQSYWKFLQTEASACTLTVNSIGIADYFNQLIFPQAIETIVMEPTWNIETKLYVWNQTVFDLHSS
jgi:hypothetical protein